MVLLGELYPPMLSKRHFLTSLADVKKDLLSYDFYGYTSTLLQKKEGLIMKKFIALGAALIVLLFGVAASAEVTVAENSGVRMRSDIPLPIYPYD